MQYSEAEISKSGIGKLKVAKSTTDLLTTTISNDTLRLSLDTGLNNLYGVDDLKAASKNGDALLLLYQFQSTLSDIVKTNNLYQSVYIYLDNSNYVLTSDGVIQKDSFEDTGWIKYYTENKELKKPISWLNTRLNGIENENMPLDSLNKNNNRANYVLSYVYPLTPYTTKLRGAVVINVFENALCKQINSNNSDSEGYISIINTNGDVISHVDKTLAGANIKDMNYIKQILSSKPSEGYLITNINKKRYLVTYFKTDLNNWIYVGVFSLDTLTKKINSFKLLIIYISIILLVTGILTSFIVSRKLYNPVKKLVQEIKSRKGIDIIGNESEESLLSKAFDTIIKQEDQLFNTLEKNKRNLRENYLLGLLKGKTINTDDQNDVGVEFPFQHFLCAIIAIDRFKDFTTNFSSEQQYYLKTVILNICEEVFGSSLQCSGLVMERDKIVLIINTGNSNFSYIFSIIKESFAIVQKEVSKVIDSTITVCIGNLYNDLPHIKTSYFEAQNSLKLRFIQGHGSIICDQDSHIEESKYYYPFTMEKHILYTMDAGSKEAILSSVSDFINELKENKELTYDNVILILNQLLGSTIKYLLDLNISVSMVFGNDFNIYTRLTENETLDETGLWLAKIYLRIIEYCEKPKCDGKKHIANILEYIRKNYTRDIDVNTLADHVGLSYSHVRKIFIDETGENIVNYINNLRIEEAQRLLRQTNMNVNNIALSLGYNNNQSFNRFFKKYVGVTPGEYRYIKS